MAARTSMALPGCQMHQIYKVHLLPAVTVDAALTEDTAIQLNDQPEPYHAHLPSTFSFVCALYPVGA